MQSRVAVSFDWTGSGPAPVEALLDALQTIDAAAHTCAPVAGHACVLLSWEAATELLFDFPDSAAKPLAAGWKAKLLGTEGKPMARRATPEEIAGWTVRLKRWQRPEEFAALVTEIAAVMGDHGIDQHGSPFRDAWTAARAAQLVGAAAVRLVDDRNKGPDFECMIDGAVVRCQSVEVMEPGRRRGDELKAARAVEASGGSLGPQQAGFLETDAALSQMSAKTRAKAEYGYPRDLVLVVYVNLGFLDDEAAFRGGWRKALEPALGAFEEVWVLDQRTVHRLRQGA